MFCMAATKYNGATFWMRTVRGKWGAVFNNRKVAKIMAAWAIFFAVLVVISIFQTVHA